MRTPAVAVAFALSAALASPALADRKLDESLAKAEEQLKKGKPDDALKTLRKAIQQAPGEPAAHRALARLHERLGDLESAGASYAQAAEVASAAAVKSAALADLAQFELRTSSTAQVRAHAEEAVRLAAAAPALSVLARVQARLGDPAALQTAERARQAAADSADAHVAFGEAALAAERAEEAASAFRRARELEAANVSAAAGLARALCRLGWPAEAIAAGREAVALDERRAEGLTALALALLAADPRDAQDEAIGQAQQATFLEPRNASVKLAVARVFEARGQLDQAANAYREAAALDPTWPAARLGPAHFFYLRHDVEGALAEIAGLAPDLAGTAPVALLHAKVLLLKEDPAAAVAVLEKAGAAIARSAEAQATLGAAYYAIRKADKAAAAYRAAADLEPGNDTYVTNYALFLAYAGRHQEAATALTRLTSRPGYADPAGFINLGWTYRSMRPVRVKEALAAYRRALEVAPKSGQAALGIALTYYRAKLWGDSVRAFERAAQVDARVEGDAFNGIAWCHFFQRDMRRARNWAEKARGAGNPDAEAVFAAARRFEQALKYGEPQVRRVINDELRLKDQGDLRDVVEQLGSGSPAQQRRAAAQLCQRGAEAVPYLAYALLRADLGAREQIVPCLGGMGARARAALVMLDRLVAQGPPTPDPNATPAGIAIEVREAALLSAMRNAASRIRGGK